MNFGHRLALLTTFLGCPVGSHTQTLPDAGSVRQQIEQQRSAPLPRAMAPTQATAPTPTPGGLVVPVQAFQLTGNTLLSSEQLAPTLSAYIGKELDFAGLQHAADAVAAAYRQAGWMARVYMPEQDVSTGTVTLQVVEARFAGLRLEGQVSQRIQSGEIEAYFLSRQTVGQPLNADALDRALLLADDLPGISVAGTLEPGSNDGETALVLQTTDEPFMYGDIGLDNTGARSTGSQRVTANLNVNSPWQRGDLLSLNLLHTQGSDYGRIALTFPYGHDGLRWGLSASSMHYRIIDGLSAGTMSPIQGRSGSLGLDWNYPLRRSRELNLYFSGGLDDKTFYTEDTQVRADYTSRSVRMGLSGNHFDGLGGGGVNSASLQWTKGQLADMRAHTLIDTIDRGYQKLNYSLTRLQTLMPNHSLLLSLQGQHATQVLDTSEKFYIGGGQSVRAYPTSELGGERGQMLSAEWRWNLASDLVLSAFADMGRVVSLPTALSDTSHTWQLSGHGLSLSWQSPLGLATKLVWAHRNGVNPHPSATGTDGDGTLQLNRLWLTASWPF